LPISSHSATVHATYGQSLRQWHADAKDRILLENFYRFKHFGPKKLIPGFYDKDWTV